MTEIKTYKGCGDMPIYNFMMYLGKFDLKYLIIDYNSHADTHLSTFIKVNKEVLEKTMMDARTEYSALTFNKKELIKKKEVAQMMFLEAKYNVIVKIIEIYLDTGDFSVFSAVLEEFSIVMNEQENISKQIKKLTSICTGLKMKLNIKTANFKIKYKINDIDITEDVNEGVDGTAKSLDQQALMLENNLETGYKIETKETSVLRWVNLLEMNERKLQNI